jgi:hypothetical protein
MAGNVVDFDEFIEQRVDREALAELRVERAELVTWIQSDANAFYFTKMACISFAEHVLNHSDLYSDKWQKLARDILE